MDLSKYHFGWRDYDPELGRWHVVDPARQFASPYVFNANNPINLYDADGRRTAGAPELWQILDYINELNQQMREGSMRDMDSGSCADGGNLDDDNKEPLRDNLMDNIKEKVANELNENGLDENGEFKVEFELPSWFATESKLTVSISPYDLGSETTASVIMDNMINLTGGGAIGTMIGLMFGTPVGVGSTAGAIFVDYARGSENRMLSAQDGYTSQGYKISISVTTYSFDGSYNRKTVNHYHNNNNNLYFSNTVNSYGEPIYP